MNLKKFFIILTMLALLVSLISCSSSDSNKTDGATTTTGTPFTPNLASLREAMITKYGVEDAITFESDVLLDLYGIVAEDVAESACYMTMDGVFPQEIIMIKAANEEAAARIVTALEKRISEVKIQSESYDPENYALAQKCKVAKRDIYVTMFLSPNFDEMTQMFNSAK